MEIKGIAQGRKSILLRRNGKIWEAIWLEQFIAGNGVSPEDAMKCMQLTANAEEAMGLLGNLGRRKTPEKYWNEYNSAAIRQTDWETWPKGLTRKPTRVRCPAHGEGSAEKAQENQLPLQMVTAL